MSIQAIIRGSLAPDDAKRLAAYILSAPTYAEGIGQAPAPVTLRVDSSGALEAETLGLRPLTLPLAD